MMIQILREESDWDLMYYLESINTPEQALEVIKTLRNKLVDKSQQELNKEMGKYNFISKENLIGTFATIVEKQRGYPLWMWEYSDIEDWAKAWADDNGYVRLFIEEDWDDWVENRKDYLFDDLNNILFEKHSELIEYIKGWLNKHKLADDSMIVWELASEFIDKKELYDLDYDD